MSEVDQHYRWSTKDLSNIFNLNRLIYLSKNKSLDLRGLLYLTMYYHHLIYFFLSSSSSSSTFIKKTQQNNSFIFLIHLQIHRQQQFYPFSYQVILFRFYENLWGWESENGVYEFRKKLRRNPIWKGKLRFCFGKTNHTCLLLGFIVVAIEFCCCWCRFCCCCCCWWVLLLLFVLAVGFCWCCCC